MADTLRQRVARVIAGGVHALLDKLEDTAPVAMLEQSVREIDSIVDEVRAELGRAVVNRHLSQQQHFNLNQEHQQLESSIIEALNHHREDLAKPAMARQIDIEAQLPVLENTLADLGQQEKELTGYVDALMSKKREMQNAIHALEQARHQAQSAATRGLGVATPVGAKLEAAQSSFDRVYQRQTGLDATSRGASLEQSAKLKELNDLVRENKINERLAALKAN